MAKVTCLWCGVSIPQVWTIHRVFSFSENVPEPCCKACEMNLPWVDLQSSCRFCCRRQASTVPCSDCKRWKLEYSERDISHRAIFYYEGVIREWLHAFKYQGDYRLVHLLTKEWQAALTPYVRTHQIVPIPISIESASERGFNQVEALLIESCLPYQAVLKHRSSAKKQAEKNRKERMESPQIFYLPEETKIKWEVPHLIVDDVYTTGRTLHHARDVLEAAGVKKIETLTLAR